MTRLISALQHSFNFCSTCTKNYYAQAGISGTVGRAVVLLAGTYFAHIKRLYEKHQDNWVKQNVDPLFPNSVIIFTGISLIITEILCISVTHQEQSLFR